jgi:excinuclease UvrABC nuclease subunit
MTVEQIFGLSLKTIPGVGRNSVEALLKYFKSFKCMYNELKKL